MKSTKASGYGKQRQAELRDTLLFIHVITLPITLIGALVLAISCVSTARAEQPYLLIPGAIGEAEQMARAAGSIGQEPVHVPRTASEAMEMLRRIDSELDTIIRIGQRFRSTCRMIEHGIRNAQKIGSENQKFIRTWYTATEGNYKLIHTVIVHENPYGIRSLIILEILENLMRDMPIREKSIQEFKRIELQLSRESQMISSAQKRLRGRLNRLTEELKLTQTTTEMRM